MTRTEPANDGGKKEEPGASSTWLGMIGVLIAVAAIVILGGIALASLFDSLKPIALQANAALTPHVRPY